MSNPKNDTRFKPGQSGNPNGRPKKSTHPSSIGNSLGDILSEKMHIVENGKQRLITKEEALYRNTINMAFKGDMRAYSFIMKELSRKAQLASEPPIPSLNVINDICPICTERDELTKKNEKVEINEENIRNILAKLREEY